MKPISRLSATLVTVLFVTGSANAQPAPTPEPAPEPAPSGSASGGAATPSPSPAPAPAPAEKPPAPAPAEKPPAPAPAAPLPGASDTAPPAAASSPKKAVYGVGANYQFLIVPQFFLKAFLKAAKNGSYNLYRHGFGAHFVRRKGSLDIVVRLMFGFMMSEDDDGNWLGRGHDWREIDYTEFHDLNFLCADVSFIYHWKIAKGLFFGLGGGVGLGYVMGEVYTTESYVNGVIGAACDGSNYSNCSICHPQFASCTSSSCDRASLQTNPDREKSKDVPPVLPTLNGLMTLRYDIWKHTSVRLATGIFLPGFFMLDVSLEWVF